MRPRVLMFGWEYPPAYSGGMGIVTRSIVQNLKQHNVDVVLVLPKVPRPITGTEFVKLVNASKLTQKIDHTTNIETHPEIKNILVNTLLSPYISEQEYKQKIEQLKIKNLIPGLNTNCDDSGGELYGKDLLAEVHRYAHKAHFVAKENNHDIIHTHDWMTAQAGIAAKNSSGKPLVVHIHATEFDRTGGNPSQAIYDMERGGMENADRVIAVSQLTKNKIIENYGISPDKIQVVHNAVDKIPGATKLGKTIKRTDKIVLFLGRLTMQKGAEFLLNAAAEVLKHKKRVKFVFIGKGDLLDTLIQRSTSLGIQKKVIFAGFLTHSEVDRAYQNADVFVMPSVSEPFGITPLEAIKNGTPVIISKQSGVSEVIKHALKVDFWDTHELANQILSVLKYPQLNSELKENSNKELDKINWLKQSEKIVDVYKNILQ